MLLGDNFSSVILKTYLGGLKSNKIEKSKKNSEGEQFFRTFAVN